MIDYTIQWSKIELSILNEDIGAPFYAVDKDGEVIFVSTSYKKKLRYELRDTLASLSLNSKMNLSIWGGIVANTNGEPVTRQEADDILCLLIFRSQPKMNVICRTAYYGSTSVGVRNYGGIALEERVSIDSDNIILRRTAV